MKSFLLRFEEQTVPGRTTDDENRSALSLKLADSNNVAYTIVAGTKTITEVRHEGIDEDPDNDWRDLLAIPR